MDSAHEAMKSGAPAEVLRRGLEGSPNKYFGTLIIDSYGNTVTRVKVLPAKPCNQCARPAPYVIYLNGHPWGWRLCWHHLPKDAGLLLYK